MCHALISVTGLWPAACRFASKVTRAALAGEATHGPCDEFPEKKNSARGSSLPDLSSGYVATLLVGTHRACSRGGHPAGDGGRRDARSKLYFVALLLLWRWGGR